MADKECMRAHWFSGKAYCERCADRLSITGVLGHGIGQCGNCAIKFASAALYAAHLKNDCNVHEEVFPIASRSIEDAISEVQLLCEQWLQDYDWGTEPITVLVSWTLRDRVGSIVSTGNESVKMIAEVEI